LPRQSDDPDHRSTLPQAELNPLLNPTLGRNMGRWAEVYFTSDPEKREEAILQLLHELENESPQAKDTDVAPSSSRRPPVAAKTPVTPIAADRAYKVTCFWCGYVNRPEYKFCGSCGEPLAGLDAGLDGNGLDRSESPSHGSALTHSFPRGRTGRGFSTTPDEVPSILTTTPERSFRPWFAAVLAVVVLALAYVSWRGAPAKSAFPPTAMDQTPPVQIPPTTTQSQAATPAAQQIASGTNTTAQTQTPTAETQTSASPKTASVIPTVSPSTENAATAPTTTGKGFAELAQAQDFLNGTNGRERNTAQAAQWLWKAVRKENADATMLLSELYLRGDGVPKSCEQARLLLDAAALKGRKDAAGELRNLSAFGCQ
jgi:hypothetical protein